MTKSLAKIFTRGACVNRWHPSRLFFLSLRIQFAKWKREVYALISCGGGKKCTPRRFKHLIRATMGWEWRRSGVWQFGDTHLSTIFGGVLGQLDDRGNMDFFRREKFYLSSRINESQRKTMEFWYFSCKGNIRFVKFSELWKFGTNCKFTF